MGNRTQTEQGREGGLTALEALRVTAGAHDIWCRPVAWRGNGKALIWDHRYQVATVPSATGAAPLLLSHIWPWMDAEWEVVSSTEVLDEQGTK